MNATRDRAAIDAIKANRGALMRELEATGATIHGTSVTCPFHDDKHPSGGIHQDDRGVWLYTCQGCGWNHGKSTGDVLAVVMAHHGHDFPAALRYLGIEPNNARSAKQLTKPRAKAPSPDDLAAAKTLAEASHRRLVDDHDALECLWRTRGIAREIVERFRLGVTGEPDRRFITMPVENGEFIGVKAHRLDGQPQKSWWKPTGVNRAQAWPICLEHSGPVFVCPGELKALAVVGVGVNAIGITSGEASGGKTNPLPESALAELKGRAVALPHDDDDTGEKWGADIRKQIQSAGVDARILDLDLDAGAGLKDIGDLVTRELVEHAREPIAVRESLLHAYKLSDPWHRFSFGEILTAPSTWTPAIYLPTGLTALDECAGGGLRTGGVHMLVGKPGKGKTQFAAQLASNISMMAKMPAAFFSLELTRQDLAKLIVSQNTAIPRRVLDAGELPEGYQESFDQFTTQHRGVRLSVIDDERWDGALGRDRFAELVADGVKLFGWRLVVLDYLGLLAAGERDRSEYETDLLNSTVLKRIARRHDVALLVVASLRKSASFAKKEKRSEITLDDVSGAGRLTYDATTVWLVDATHARDGYPGDVVNLRCLKSRFSSASSSGQVVELYWQPHIGRISDWVGGHQT